MNSAHEIAVQRLSKSDDWIGYGKVAITLPERKIVNVYYADIAALDHRKNNVLENFARIQQAMEVDVARINKLQAMMMKMDVATAGPAIKVLSALADANRTGVAK